MHSMPQILPMLKQLHLSGMMDSLEVRTKQAATQKLAHMEFLALLLGDELARRDQHKFVQRQRRSKINPQKTLETFDFSFNQQGEQHKIHDIATGRYIDEKAPVLLMGPCGTGKSHLAHALGHQALRQGREVIFSSHAKLLAQLTAARASGVYTRTLNKLARVQLLIIDDFGLKPMRQGQDEDFHDLIAERYEQQATVLTSNLHFEEWQAAFPNKVLGAATLDRLLHGAYCVVLDGKSYRTPRQ